MEIGRSTDESGKFGDKEDQRIREVDLGILMIKESEWQAWRFGRSKEKRGRNRDEEGQTSRLVELWIRNVEEQRRSTLE